MILAILGGVLDIAMGDTSEGAGIITGLVVLVHLIPMLSVSVRRLHDIGRSGWWLLISVVPLAGLITMLVFTCTGSQAGENRFGAAPVSAGPNAEPVAAQVPTSTTPQLDALEKLAALRSSNAITEEEYQKMKSDALARTVG